jgi:hypothetical protein
VRRLDLLLGLALGLLLAGCTLVNDPGQHQDPIGENDFCEELARLSCTGLAECCPTPEANEVSFDECVRLRESLCRAAELYGPVFEDPRTGYDPVVAAQVMAEGYAFIENACDPGIYEWRFRRQGLYRVLTGTVEGGDFCTPEGEDDPAALFSCVASDPVCRPDFTGTRWSCTSSAGTEGEPCIAFLDCAAEHYCDAGTCRRSKADGEPCGEGIECLSLFCNPSGRCQDPGALGYCRLF